MPLKCDAKVVCWLNIHRSEVWYLVIKTGSFADGNVFA